MVHLSSVRIIVCIMILMRFVWDSDKAAANPEKHQGISFDEAIETFYDEKGD